MDAAIYPYRLAECNIEIANELHKSGRADKCAGCGKLFNAARQLKSVARLSYISNDGSMHAWSWPLCRKCAREDIQTGGVHARLKREACAELALLVAAPGGVA